MPLEASWLKVKRANKEIRKLDVEFHNFDYGKPYRIIRETSTDGAEVVARFYPDDIPHEIPATTTNIVHNLRAALDNLAWDVANRTAAPTNPKSERFPIFGNGNSLLEPGPQGQVRQVGGQDWLDFIKSVKPYRAGNDLLYALHPLDIIDKHRDFIVTGFVGAAMSVGPIALGDNVTVGHLAALNEGDPVVSYPSRNEPNISLNVQIAFRNIEKPQGVPILEAVKQLRDEVARVLTAANGALF